MCAIYVICNIVEYVAYKRNISEISLLKLQLLTYLQYLVSISPTFYAQILHTKISKGEKDTDDCLTVFLRFWDLCVLKLCVNVLVKLTPRVYPTKLFTSETQNLSIFCYLTL